MKLNRHSSIPLYAQLREMIVERIDEGMYKEGEQIPSELQLCKELDLSRPTVRQAIADLVGDGVLEIRKGKGTFVAQEPERLEIPHFTALSFSFLNLNSYESIGLQDIKLIDPDPELDRLFRIAEKAGHPGYWLASWPIEDHGTILGYCRSYIPVQLFPELGQNLASGKRMVDIKSNKYAYLPQKGALSLACRPAKNQEARDLEIPLRSYVMALEGPLFARSGHVCEVLRIVLRPDLLKLELN
ncbi:MAG: GntR family transcriptional regulator [Eubacteriales bacterium]|nr:GntR family transcriptional regulator [Eubacteriales bacterium]